MNEPRSPQPPATLEDRRPLRRAHSVASQTLDGEAVLLHLQSGTYFTLNETGTFVWDLLEAERAPAELLEALVEAFEVDDATARRDLAELLDQLLSNGLIQRGQEP